MARDLDGANDTIDNEGGLSNIDVDSATFLLWISTDGAANMTVHTLASALSAGNNGEFLQQRSGGSWRFGYRFSSTAGFWTFGTPTTSWQLISVEYDRGATTNDPNCFEDGALQTETETQTPVGTAHAGIDSERIGATAAGGTDFNGQVAHFSFWSSALGATKELALFHGVNPFALDNTNLQFYYPINGNDSSAAEYVQQATGTLVGTTKFAGNPPVELIENYL